MSIRLNFLSPTLRKAARLFAHPASLAARRIRQTIRGARRGLSHPASLVTLVILAAVVASAWGYWYYESEIRRPQELTNLRQETERLRNNLDTLSQSVEGPSTSAMRSQRRRASEVSLLSPMNGIRALDQLTLLAERTNVDLSKVQLSPGTLREVSGVELTVFDVSFSASGNLGDLTNFSLALEEGILPGLFIENIQTEVSSHQSMSHASGSLYTLSTVPSGTPTMPVFLKPGTPTFDDLESEVSITRASEVPILAFSVESQFDGMDALRSIQVQSSHPQILSSLKLYVVASQDRSGSPLGPALAPVSGDGSSAEETECRPALLSSCVEPQRAETRTLIATMSTAKGDGSYIITPASPFAFPGHREQRFYLTADLHELTAREAVVEVRIPSDGVTFTSGKWPLHDGVTLQHSVRLRVVENKSLDLTQVDSSLDKE